jgi:hypothetical protein
MAPSTSSSANEASAAAAASSSSGDESSALGPEFGDVFAGMKTRSRFASSFFQLGSFRMEGLHRQEAGFSSFNYVGLNYSLGQGEFVAFRPVFFFETAGRNFRGDPTPTSTRLGDAYVEWTRNRWQRFLGDGTVRLAWRAGLPTSQESKERGMLTYVMAYFIASKRLPWRLQLDYHSKPQAFVQSQSGYLMDDGRRVRGNQLGSYDHFLNLSYRISHRVSFVQMLGSEHDWFFPVQSEFMRGFRRQWWKYQTSLSFNLSRNAFVMAGVGHRRDIDRPEGPFALFREDETQYTVMTSLRF